MTRLVTRTIYGGELQVAKQHGLPYTVRGKTTLNEALEINQTATLAVGEYPLVKYWAIGDKGHSTLAGADGTPYISPIKHRPSDAGLFNQIPFVLRLESNDLSVAQRANYGLRRSEEIGGSRYFAYYLKRIDLTDTVASLQKTIQRDGNTTTTEFVPDNSNLNPSIPETSSTESVSADDTDYLSASALLSTNFNETDILEFIEVAKILYGSESFAVISEIGLCSGVDRSLSSPASGGGTITVNEVVATQIVQHITTYSNFGFTNQSMQLLIEAGVTESLPIES